LNYKGFTVNASGKARLSGKIPERSEDDFSAKPEGPGLAQSIRHGTNFAG
jgi:hypothetical protein